jgi:hypothetical protein
MTTCVSDESLSDVKTCAARVKSRGVEGMSKAIERKGTLRKRSHSRSKWAVRLKNRFRQKRIQRLLESIASSWLSIANTNPGNHSGSPCLRTRGKLTPLPSLVLRIGEIQIGAHGYFAVAAVVGLILLNWWCTKG